jgi:predicted small secreted protein
MKWMSRAEIGRTAGMADLSGLVYRTKVCSGTGFEKGPHLGRRVNVTVVILILTLGHAGCHTLKGMGQDLTAAGRAIQRAVTP